jgi:hypothetical protein
MHVQRRVPKLLEQGANKIPLRWSTVQAPHDGRQVSQISLAAVILIACIVNQKRGAMRKLSQPSSKVTATVTEVLPSMGLAYLVAGDKSSWAVTKSTQGRGLPTLSPGSRVELTLDHHLGFTVVSAYSAIE